jgi:hypothetical protein
MGPCKKQNISNLWTMRKIETHDVRGVNFRLRLVEVFGQSVRKNFFVFLHHACHLEELLLAPFDTARNAFPEVAAKAGVDL